MADLLRYAKNLLDGPLKQGGTAAQKSTIPELFADIITALALPDNGLNAQGVTYVTPSSGTLLAPQASLVYTDRKSPRGLVDSQLT